MNLTCKDGELNVQDMIYNLFPKVRAFVDDPRVQDWAREHTMTEVFQKVQEGIDPWVGA